MKTIAKLLGGGSSSDYKMDAIYDFEKSIAEVCYCLNCRQQCVTISAGQVLFRSGELLTKVSLSCW